MPLHPDAPEDVCDDPDKYALWRLEHREEDDELLGLTKEERLAYFRVEFFDSMETEESIAIEDAEIELRLARERGGKEH